MVDSQKDSASIPEKPRYPQSEASEVTGGDSAHSVHDLWFAIFARILRHKEIQEEHSKRPR